MLNKLERFLRRYALVQPGEQVICAVSGGADSVALLFAMFLLQEKLQITISAAHFNHQLRGEESDRDQQFVQDFCSHFDIPLHLGGEQVVPGKKGLEAAARDARYRYFRSLNGKIATAHTADDNTETVLMHMIRGTGLRGLGGIAPINGNLIRPMLEITRHEVMEFLQEYHLDYISDSSNSTDQFLRNRLRHHVIPLLKQENPCLAENVSEMALRLRLDEQVLQRMAAVEEIDVTTLRQMHPAIRSRAISCFLEKCGVPEPESEHVALVEKLAFSEKPSAKANFPGGVTIERNYNVLVKSKDLKEIEEILLPQFGAIELPELGLRITVSKADGGAKAINSFEVLPCGKVYLRSRMPGDTMRLPGGTKELKKIYIDRKIPASSRSQIPVIVDDKGVLGVYGIGVNLDRVSAEGIKICFENI